MGPQISGQSLQLVFDLIPFHGYGGAVERDDPAVAHRGSPTGFVGGSQFDIACGDEVLGNDYGFGLGGDRYIVVDRQRHSGSGALGVDAVDTSDDHACDLDIVAGVDRDGFGEVGGDRRGPEHSVPEQHCDAGNENYDQDGGSRTSQRFAATR